MSMKNREQETDLVKLMNRSNKMADAASRRQRNCYEDRD